MSHHHPALWRLVYYSRNRIAGPDPAVAADIDAILAAARRNNPAFDVTGALIFNSGIFAQVLEGPRDGVEAIFERIQRDLRHGEVQVLAFEETATRFFPSWSMGFIGRSRQGEHLFSSVGAATGFDERALEGERILAIMRDIAIEEEPVG